MIQNIKFNYLYRDAGNYKSWGDVIFANSDDLLLSTIEKRLKQAFEQEVFFIADRININELFFEEITDDDHCYHEFDSVEITDKDVTDSLNRKIKSFIEQIEAESMRGWRAFDVVDRHLTSTLGSLKNLSSNCIK